MIRAPAVAAPIGWDDPDTARYYARFNRRHGRYRSANRVLVEHATLGSGMRVLDVGAGVGGTAAATLGRLGRAGSVVCCEPAAAMRALGERMLHDRRVRWTGTWPGDVTGAVRPFDRILCGAAIWQLAPLDATFRRMHALLRPGGCLCFNVPAAYLGEPDEPGGGGDPLLLSLPAALATECPEVGREPASPVTGEDVIPDAAVVDELLASAGFRSGRWRFRARLRQSAYRDWLKIPPTTDRLLLGLTADERARRIDRAFRRVDPTSWRWEGWVGWTAWKPA